MRVRLLSGAAVSVGRVQALLPMDAETDIIVSAAMAKALNAPLDEPFLVFVEPLQAQAVQVRAVKVNAR